MSGWIKLHRSLTTWEWYDDINVKVTFLHLLLSANHAPKKWRGINIGRGQLWTSIGNLSKETGLSEKQMRISLKKLESTNEISVKGASKGTMVTICKYDTYQDFKEDKGEQSGKLTAIKGQSKGEQRATNKNDNNYKNEEEEEEETPDFGEPDLFEIFWQLYKKGTNRVPAQKEWFNIDHAEYAKIIEHAPKYANATPTFRKDAVNYLKDRNWLDTELPNQKETTSKQQASNSVYLIDKDGSKRLRSAL